jgi:hypothetical protein
MLEYLSTVSTQKLIKFDDQNKLTNPNTSNSHSTPFELMEVVATHQEDAHHSNENLPGWY